MLLAEVRMMPNAADLEIYDAAHVLTLLLARSLQASSHKGGQYFYMVGEYWTAAQGVMMTSMMVC